MTEKMLDDLAYGFSQSDAELFDSVHADFEKNASVSPDEQSRILSSVMRKAGAEMKENNTVKRTRRHSKRFVGFAIAAALFATGAVGAGATYAYKQLSNRTGVEHYMGEQTADEIESMGLAFNDTSENGHIRMTVDTAISDGNFARLIITLEKLDDEARSIVDDSPLTGVYYADTGEECTLYVNSGAMSWEPGVVNDPLSDVFTFKTDIIPYEADFSRMITLKFHSTSDWDEPDIYDGIEITVDLSKNVDSVTMTSEYGGKLTLTPFTLVGEHILPQESDSDFFDIDKYFMIRSDGTREPMFDHHMDGYAGYYPVPHIILDFRDSYDLDNYIGVEIDGVEYLKQ